MSKHTSSILKNLVGSDELEGIEQSLKSTEALIKFRCSEEHQAGHCGEACVVEFEGKCTPAMQFRARLEEVREVLAKRSEEANEKEV